MPVNGAGKGVLKKLALAAVQRPFELQPGMGVGPRG